MYARGISTREMQGYVRELYGIEVSPELISKVTDAVLDELAAWQSQPLGSVYAIVYLDAVRVKIRDEGLVRNKAVYLAIGYTCDGFKQILGLWIEQMAPWWPEPLAGSLARGELIVTACATASDGRYRRWSYWHSGVPCFVSRRSCSTVHPSRGVRK